MVRNNKNWNNEENIVILWLDSCRIDIFWLTLYTIRYNILKKMIEVYMYK